MAFKKGRETATEDRNRKIEQMGLIELKRYLCMKNGQNPEKCDGCPGVKTCTAGQRAIVLLNERKVHEAMAKEKAEKPLNKQAGKTREERRQETRALLIAACQQEDMIRWLVETDGGNRMSARENLKYWARSNPDIAEMYGFWEKFEALSDKKKSDNAQSWTEKRKAEAIGKWNTVKDMDDPFTYMMEHYGMTHKQAHKNFHNWKKRYGHVGGTSEQTETASVDPKDDDEISVEDFLNEMETIGTMDVRESPSEPETGCVAEDEAGEETPESVSADEIVKAVNEPMTVMPDEFKLMSNGTVANGFRAMLESRYAELKQEKETLESRIAWVNKAIESLAMTMDIFGEENRA